MICLSRLEANRANAQKSTGPKSAKGKARSAQNARKHGLRTKVTSDPHYRSEVLVLRTKLAKEAGHASSPIDALSLAMTELRRIITIRHKRLDDALIALEGAQEIDVAPLLTDLETLERYERRAHYRLHRAVEVYAPAPGGPSSRKQHLPNLGRQTRSAPPLRTADPHRPVRPLHMTSPQSSGSSS